MDPFLICFTAGAGFLLGILLFFHPLRQNVKANIWPGFFVLTISFAFISVYIDIIGVTVSNHLLFRCLNALQFLMAPSLYISILYFVKPAKHFQKEDLLHFIPFVIYFCVELLWSTFNIKSLFSLSLFSITENISFLIRDILPFLLLFYLVKSYVVLKKHKLNLKIITSSIEKVDLNWLVQFLFILLIITFVWINDAFFELPVLTKATNLLYLGGIVFLAVFSIKQKTIFAFNETDLQEISEVIETPKIETENVSTKPKERKNRKRLTEEHISDLNGKLISLMENDKLFLDNELSLPTVAERLGVSIHDASFLINEITDDNFYNFINRYRVKEAQKLLKSSEIDRLNILGIAFASGFNSKTTFNTAFKKWVGVSPSQYAKKTQ